MRTHVKESRGKTGYQGVIVPAKGHGETGPKMVFPTKKIFI